MRTNLERTVWHEDMHYNQYYQVALLSLVTCKQRADHFTPMMWFDFIKWRFYFIRGRFHYSECIKYCEKYVKQNRISHETHNLYVYTTWEIQPRNLGFTQMTSKAEWKIKIFCLSWYLYAFCGTTCGHFVVIWRGQSVVAGARMRRVNNI